MIKKSILVVIFTLFFAGCVERGHIVDVPQKRNFDSNMTMMTKDPSIPTLVVNANDIDTVKNNLSGGLILLIGIIIFL